MICRKCKKKASNVIFDVIIVANMPLKSLELYLWLVDVNKKILHILKILANIRMFGLVKRHHRQTNDNGLLFHCSGVPEFNKVSPFNSINLHVIFKAVIRTTTTLDWNCLCLKRVIATSKPAYTTLTL